MKIDTARARKHLDERLKPLQPAQRFARPPKGWIRAIRQALGMSAAQLAQRMGLSQPRIAQLEKAEASGTLQLDTLARAAEALDCTLVYALVPNTTLENMVQNRARAKAKGLMPAIHHSMRLENQALSATDLEAALNELADKLAESPRKLWDNSPPPAKHDAPM